MTIPIEILKREYDFRNKSLTTPRIKEEDKNWKRKEKSQLKEIKKAIDILEAIMQTGY